MTLAPELTAAIAGAFGGVSLLLTAIAAYVRGAAKALEQRNESLDVLATFTQQLKDGQDKQKRDLDACHDGIRSLRARLDKLEDP